MVFREPTMCYHPHHFKVRALCLAYMSNVCGVHCDLKSHQFFLPVVLLYLMYQLIQPSRDISRVALIILARVLHGQATLLNGRHLACPFGHEAGCLLWSRPFYWIFFAIHHRLTMDQMYMNTLWAPNTLPVWIQIRRNLTIFLNVSLANMGQPCIDCH